MNTATDTAEDGFVLPAACLERARALMARGGRRLLGVVGPPGAGKSTLAEHLSRALAGQAQVVAMDGFHLSNAVLAQSGRLQRKGSADTFDADGYVHLLRRLRQQTADAVVYAPAYVRGVEESIGGSVAVHGSTPLVITEGNYLLMEDGPWSPVRGLLDEVWYLDVNDGLREARLLARHREFGKTAEAALVWIASTDAPNALQISLSRARADWHVVL